MSRQERTRRRPFSRRPPTLAEAAAPAGPRSALREQAGRRHGLPGKTLQIDEDSRSCGIIGAAAKAGPRRRRALVGWRMADNTFLKLADGPAMIQLAAAVSAKVESLRVIA